MNTSPELRHWRLDLICCGRDDGFIVRDTWEEADQFRQAYTSGTGVYPDDPGGHQRAAILTSVSEDER